MIVRKKQRTKKKKSIYSELANHILENRHKVAKRLSTLVKVKFQVDLAVYYNSFKTGSYFNLKCLTPHAFKK